MSNDNNQANTRHAVQRLVTQSGLSNPREIADKMIAGASVEEREQWLTEALPKFVADVLRTDRNHALAEATTSGAGNRRMPARSAKVAQVRDWWSRFLESRISVGGAWKPVGAMTADDLEVVIADRRAHAAATIAQADRLAAILSLMAEHGAATVADLPRSSVEQVAA